jgi:tyrosinase
LAVYEQLLVQNAIEAANEFQGSDQQRYLSAAQNLRIPYWDWAAPQNGGNTVPDVLVQPQITVNTPSGQQTIDNPVYSYKFTQSTQNLVYSPFTSWDKTYRHPVSQDNPTQNDDQDLISTMNGQQSNLASRLFNLFANYQNFAMVSNEAWAQGQSGNYDSIESIHDAIHGLFGGGNNGDMSIIDVSAFDPAFWLHHTMVDRFFALWQTLYPDTYVESANQIYGNYWYTSGTTLDANSPLFPFHSDAAGNFHTSNSVRDFTQFGYRYPEITGNVNDIVAAVNTLYGANQPQAGSKKRSDPLSDLTGALSDVGDVIESAVSDVSNIVADIGSYLGVSSPREYIVNVRTDKNALGGSYFIYVFVGDVPKDSAKWATSDSLVGIQAITSMVQGSLMGPAIVAGTIPLTRFLEKHVVLKLLSGLDEDLVVPYLTDNLIWKVLDVSTSNRVNSTLLNILDSQTTKKSQHRNFQISKLVSYPPRSRRRHPSMHSPSGWTASQATTKSRATRKVVSAQMKKTRDFGRNHENPFRDYVI